MGSNLHLNCFCCLFWPQIFASLSLSQSSHSSGTVTQEKLKTDRTNFLLIGAQEIAPHFNLLPHSQIDM